MLRSRAMTMLSLTPCPSCACHVKDGDATCPFCGASLPHVERSWRAAPLKSRAAWLAFGSSLVAIAGAATIGACSSASSDDHTAGGATFPCGDAGACSVATQFCGVSAHQTGCGNDFYLVYECAPKEGNLQFPAECLDLPKCTCVEAYLPAPPPPWENGGSGTSCSEDDAGGVILTYGSGGQCAGCYGAPPARLERMGLTVS
jgi:hypothetical protein